MEIREFAKGILFSPNLEDKLLVCQNFTDHNPGDSIATPEFPARSEKLRFADRNAAKTSFPSTSHFHYPSVRGQVLHFFANHELLALELMALTLLKFPTAPAKFRQGIVDTMLEEQKHLLLYKQRMEEFSVGFGDVTLSSFFWDSLKNIKSPLDYVIQMSMTFEQANIDFAKFYHQAFIKVEDQKTADIMKIIYDEEIGHVKYGYNWFKTWEQSTAETEWEDYCKHLQFPLTPMRAKGLSFDAEARKKIGFSDDYIQKLKLYNHSKGRLPTVFYFNSNVEDEIALGGNNFSPNKQTEAFQKDFEITIALLANKDDMVVVQEKPSIEFITNWNKINLGEVEFCQWHHKQKNIPDQIKKRNLGQLQPWAWNNYIHNRFAKWQPLFKQNFLAINDNIYAKSWSVELGKKWLNSSELQPEYICPITIYGNSFHQPEEAFSKVVELLEQGKIALIKPNFGSSGRHMFQVRDKSELNENLNNRLINMINLYKSIVVEEYLDKLADLSIQIKVDQESKQVVKGITRFITNEKGQYQGHIINNFYKDLPKQLIQRFNASSIPSLKLQSYLHKVGEFVANELLNTGYEGYAGIDCLIYEQNSQYFLKPIVEINPRITMGHLALKLTKKVCQGREAIWQHFNSKQISDLGFASFSDYAIHLNKNFPLDVSSGDNPVINSGVFFTNDPQTTQVRLGILHVLR